MFSNQLKLQLPEKLPACVTGCAKPSLFVLSLMLFTYLSMTPAFARDQWQIYNPDQPPPPAPYPHGAVIPNTTGAVPKVTSDFWQQQLSNRVAAGTVFSGILEDRLSSAKSRRGDIFSIRLQDGFALNGNQIIPANTRIIGSVTDVVSAKSLRYGQPGTISVSLQSLVLPDGRNIPFFGFIAWNASMDKHQNSKTKPVSDTANKAERMGSEFLGAIGARVGFAVARPRMFDPGEEFIIDKGEVLPVRLNKALTIQPEGLASTPAGNPLGTSIPETTLPQSVSKTTPWTPTANYSSNPYNRLAPPAVPGLIGPDGQDMPQQMSYRQGGPAPNVPGTIGGQSMPLSPYVPQNMPQGQGMSQAPQAFAVGKAQDAEPF